MKWSFKKAKDVTDEITRAFNKRKKYLAMFTELKQRLNNWDL